MIKVVGSKSCNETEFLTDPYVPITFRCLTYSAFPYLYWRINTETCFIEIGLSISQSAISSVKLLLLPKISQSTQDETIISKDCTEINGIPICDLVSWENSKYIDEIRKVRTILNEDIFYILLADKIEVIKLYTVGDFSIGINKEQEIILIRLKKLSNEAISNILLNSVG